MPGSLDGARILVTGAAGFLGRHLCRRLGADGASVVGVSRRPLFDAPPAGVSTWLQADLGLESECARVMGEASPDVIYQLAGAVSGSRARSLVKPTFLANLASTVYLMELIQLGSLEEPTEENEIAVSPYGVSKTAATTYLKLYARVYELKAVIARVFMAYGPGEQDENKLLPHVIRTLLGGEDPKLSSGKRGVDWVYVDDVTEGLVRVAERAGALAGQRVDIGSGELVEVREVVDRVYRLASPGRTPLLGTLPDRADEAVRRADMAATRRQLDWVPEVPLDEGLARMIKWFRANA
jgi:nucleoside-diphosphate-sugar epimerase